MEGLFYILNSHTVSFKILSCRIFDSLFIACQCGKGRKLGCTVPHRHPRMMLWLVMWQIDDIVVISHNSQLSLVSSYLFIAFLGCGTFLKVQTSEDGVFAETFLDFQLCLLHPPLLIQLGLLFLMLLG